MTEKPNAFPSREAVLDFIRESPVPVGKREIARAFRLSGAHRLALKQLLKDLEQDGSVERGRRHRLAPPSALPDVTIVVIGPVDADGDVTAQPAHWHNETPPPPIIMAPERRGRPALATGDRVLARLERQTDGSYRGRTIRRLDRGEHRFLATWREGPGGHRLVPVDRRARTDYALTPTGEPPPPPGTLVLAEMVATRSAGPRQAKILEVLGNTGEPQTASLIAIHNHGLPTAFPAEALDEANRGHPITTEDREDLRSLPLVTIDGADARDFDDAVWATPDTAADNKGGWHLVVAIADVAHYVRPGSALDRAALARGNSAYFPDRVVPMLPEALSDGLCSLRPHEDRACLAVHLWIDASGILRRHRFCRAIMRSAARLTYEAVQQAHDGHSPPDLDPAFQDTVIAPLYGAYRPLAAARRRRGTLDLDMPEREIKLDANGRVASIAARSRYDSHRLIEEFMIAANVAAAEALEARSVPFLYRVHDQPSPDKLESLRDFLTSLDLRLVKSQAMRPIHFTQVLKKAEDHPHRPLITEMVLRSQAQAVYAPDNIGHFGLALRRYTHFTSPIRRYADLVVHRALIRAFDLGAGGLDNVSATRLDEIGEHLSMTERRAAAAERSALDRYTAAFLAGQSDRILSGRISGVNRSGVFVRLESTGSDGFIPASTLSDDRYQHHETHQALVGQRWGKVLQAGMPVSIRVVEADPVSGSTILALVDMPDQDLATSRSRSATTAGRGGVGTRRSKTKAPRSRHRG